jgi:hypothetical protein
MVGGLDVLGNLDPVVHRHVARVYREPTIVPFLKFKKFLNQLYIYINKKPR